MENFNVEEMVEQLKGTAEAEALATGLGYVSQEKVEKETEGLKKNKDDILAQLKASKDKVKEVETELENYGKVKNVLEKFQIELKSADNIGVDEFALEDDLSAFKSKGQESVDVPQELTAKNEELRLLKDENRSLITEHNKLKKDYQVIESQITETTNQNEILNHNLRNVLIDQAIIDAQVDQGESLARAKMMAPGLKTTLGAEMVLEDGRYKAVIADGFTSVHEGVTDLMQKDDGSVFSIKNNSGGNARNITPTTKVDTSKMSKTEIVTMSVNEPEKFATLFPGGLAEALS